LSITARAAVYVVGAPLVGSTGSRMKSATQSPHRRERVWIPQPRRPRSPVRLFKNDLLERLTRTSLATTIAFWMPVSLGALSFGLSQAHLTSASAIGALAAGLAAWIPVEYFLHRFVFHLDRWVPAAARFCFLIHGCHHADPADASRDLMPLVGSVPMMCVVLASAILSLGLALGPVFFGAFCLAYLAYDVTHYGCHQWSLPGKIGAYLQRQHLLHHFRDDARHFGVTSPLCDWLFGTLRLAPPE
jgi:sterol desaturase/sphingolipid hydroxylase (fatty acid hydroxylase superfamily)